MMKHMSMYQLTMKQNYGVVFRPMKVDGKHYRTIWIDEDDRNTVKIIDQRALPQ